MEQIRNSVPVPGNRGALLTEQGTVPAAGAAVPAAGGAAVGGAADAAGGAATGAAAGAAGIVRGVLRLFASLDYRPLVEFPLPDGRRVDVAAVDPRGGFAIVEVKSSLADFRADAKWPHYRNWCDAFFFAVDPDFPRAVLPEDAGLIVADRFAGALVRTAPVSRLAAARRKALLLRFARTAAGRLAAVSAPETVRGEPGR